MDILQMRFGGRIGALILTNYDDERQWIILESKKSMNRIRRNLVDTRCICQILDSVQIINVIFTINSISPEQTTRA